MLAYTQAHSPVQRCHCWSLVCQEGLGHEDSKAQSVQDGVPVEYSTGVIARAVCCASSHARINVRLHRSNIVFAGGCKAVPCYCPASRKGRTASLTGIAGGLNKPLQSGSPFLGGPGLKPNPPRYLITQLQHSRHLHAHRKRRSLTAARQRTSSEPAEFIEVSLCLACVAVYCAKASSYRCSCIDACVAWWSDFVE